VLNLCDPSIRLCGNTMDMAAQDNGGIFEATDFLSHFEDLLDSG